MTNKRPQYEGDEAASSNSPPIKMLEHQNIVDDAILANRIGMLAKLCFYSATMTCDAIASYIIEITLNGIYT